MSVLLTIVLMLAVLAVVFFGETYIAAGCPPPDVPWRGILWTILVIWSIPGLAIGLFALEEQTPAWFAALVSSPWTAPLLFYSVKRSLATSRSGRG